MVETLGRASSAKIVEIQIAGTAALAAVKEEGFWGTNSFTNFFILAILISEGRSHVARTRSCEQYNYFSSSKISAMIDV